MFSSFSIDCDQILVSFCNLANNEIVIGQMCSGVTEELGPGPRGHQQTEGPYPLVCLNMSNNGRDYKLVVKNTVLNVNFKLTSMIQSSISSSKIYWVAYFILIQYIKKQQKHIILAAFPHPLWTDQFSRFMRTKTKRNRQ